MNGNSEILGTMERVPKIVNLWYWDRSVSGVLSNRKTSRSLDNISINRSRTFAEGYVVQSGR
jgi:hypothetical protein